MTFAHDVVEPVPGAPILWITGLSGTGKSTLARAFTQALRRVGPPPLLLDGDSLRNALEGDVVDKGAVDHGPAARRQRAWRIARLARLAAEQGVPVVVATISLFHEVQAFNRSGAVPYAEVLLRADIDMLAARHPKLYGEPGQSPPRDVVGIDIVPEYPRQPELVITQGFDRASMAGHVAQLKRLWMQMLQLEMAR
jgi:adenylylsulfate kinase